jgi:hypothetical protein
MSTEYNPKTAGTGSKTLGPRSSALWVELNERGKTKFTLQDAEETTG